MAEWFQAMAEWFWPRFDPNKSKLYLKSAVVRMNLKKKKGQEMNKQAEKEISELVKQEKEDLARLKVEQLVREQHLLEAYDILELFCEIVVTRLQLIHMYPAIPEDLVEAVHTLTWASLRIAIPELRHLASQFKLKYGEEFLKEALDNTCGTVNVELMGKLSVCCPERDFVEEELFRLSPIPPDCCEITDLDQQPQPQGVTDPCCAGGGAGGAVPGPASAVGAFPLQYPQAGFIPPAVYLPTFGAPPPTSSSSSSTTAPATATSSLPAPLPFVMPELDFGDWSTPLTGSPAFPHTPDLPSSSLHFPAIPADGDAPHQHQQLPPHPGPDHQPQTEPPREGEADQLDELSARFEALKRS